ncbi:Beta-1,2-xylosyltransferase 1-like protein 2 [Colletotrichum chlorophyti]|uniref:Beta-1,2-xylosyltransferase 1-like protein 2 n=1 Tax=Colletotrichum chlorophyti TaxID=708187 RepID=A0A1Q8RRL7_9PEZI|nr:Beta-1,2-xylosyltransferase 1-like protein 2 [Colletotrichum chlorophyti]
MPGAEGRFVRRDADTVSHLEKTVPARPRRGAAFLLMFCIFLRLEVFHKVTAQLQCSTPGVESFLCLLVVVYNALFNHKTRPPVEGLPDPWTSLWDDLVQWADGSRFLVISSSFLVSYGTFIAVSTEPRSTYFCSSLLDSPLMTLLLQLLGLLLDFAIIVLLWSILAWTKTTTLRLRSLSVILVASGVLIKLVHVLTSPFVSSIEGYPPSFWAVDSLYVFDVLIDSFHVGVLLVSLVIVACETSTTTPVGLMTFVFGLLSSLENIHRIGKWQLTSKVTAIGPLYAVCVGYSMFTYATNTHSILYLRRTFFLILVIAILVGCTIYGVVKSATSKSHPVDVIIYETRVESDRWLRHAATSDSLKVAVDIYQERHYGRDPPPNFDKWYDFAKARKSVIMDHFEQMESDILPFWGLKPEAIRQACAERVPKEPHIAVVTVANKQVSHNYDSEDDHKKVLDELVKMIEGFAGHLSDMKIPINLSDQPRVLTPWSDLTRYTKTGMKQKSKLLSSRSVDETVVSDSTTEAPQGGAIVEAKDPEKKQTQNLASSSPSALQTEAQIVAATREFRDMEASVCAAGSPGRSGLHWNVRDFCSSCVKWHEDAQFMWNWPEAKSLCEQKDITRLHSFHNSAPPIRPLRELLPIFGRSKADGFNDILIPLAPLREDRPDVHKDFRQRKDALYWRGRVGARPISEEALRGNHRHRLVHLINNASAADDITMLLGAPSKGLWYGYEVVSAREANKVLPFDVGISEYLCEGVGCAKAKAELGLKAAQEPLEYRYVLLLDEDSGTPSEVLRTVRSPGSVPFMASLFGEWYSERLIPWLHFVPLDTRFQAVHSTLSYFAGLKYRGNINGREIEFESRWEDAEWIATQGARWAEKALRREDMEIYLFRLLLEWGRVVRDDRDSIGFRLKKD